MNGRLAWILCVHRTAGRDNDLACAIRAPFDVHLVPCVGEDIRSGILGFLELAGHHWRAICLIGVILFAIKHNLDRFIASAVFNAASPSSTAGFRMNPGVLMTSHNRLKFCATCRLTAVLAGGVF